MSERSSKLLLEDILESAQKILTYTHGLSFDEFIADSKTIDAVIRNFEIIGDAANRLPYEFKDHHSSVDWFKMRGFRNRIIHDYFGIDYRIVWTIKEEHVPVLISQVENILNNLN